jgi:hypothetical protein
MHRSWNSLPPVLHFLRRHLHRKLKPIRHLCGIVTNQIEERLSNAKLTLLNAGVEVRTLQSGTDGKFDFGRLEAGDYELRGESSGYSAAQHTIKVVRPTEKSSGGLQVTLGLHNCGSGIGNMKR